MQYGPCGGVSDVGACEAPSVECPFVDGRELRWPVERIGYRRADAPETDVPEFIVDLRPDISKVAELRGVAAWFDSSRYSLLVGDHVDEIHEHTPPLVARALIHAGTRAVVTLSCRDRSVEPLSDSPTTWSPLKSWPRPW